MFGHPIIDVTLGLVFFYVVLSLVASAVQEWIASACALRSKNLKAGIENLVGDDYAKEVYGHPLIKNLAKKNRLPSYIAPETLSTVLLEIIARERNGKSYLAHTADEARAMVETIKDGHPLKEILGAMVEEGDDAADALKERLAGWFDEGMSRVSGWYKRQAKLFIFIIAATVTLATNASSIHMAEELWRNDALRTRMAARAQAAVQAGDVSKVDTGILESLDSFPIGWGDREDGWLDWLKRIFGWLMTTAAVSLGAPFWFDLLGKVANLRGAGGQAQSEKSAQPRQRA